jgi:dihydroorotase (multifunctional complex type)
MMGVDTIIKNGKIVTNEGTLSGLIAVSGEKIVGITSDDGLLEAKRIIDAKGNYVIPGLVDSHMHFLDPPGEDAEMLRVESQAAAAGGCTTAITMQNRHGTGSIVKQFKEHTIKLFDNNVYMDWAVNAAVFNTDQIKEMREALEAGFCSFKFLLPYKGREAIFASPDSDDGITFLGMEQVGKLVSEGYKTHVRIHAESIEPFFQIEDRYKEQGIEPKTWTEVRPNFLEADAIQRVIGYAKETKCPLVIVHMSIKEGPGIIARARLEGVDIMVETCPQYLALNTDNTDKLTSKVNPPIRHKEDNAAMWQGIKDGVISFIGTDHCPVTKEERERTADFWRAQVGMAGVETWLPVMVTEGVLKGRITIEQLVEVCCYNTAKKNGLTPRKGMIAVGSDADLVIVDLNKKVKVDGKKFYTRAKDYTCYQGWGLQGWPILTMVRGAVIMENGKVVGKSGFGKFIAPKIK